MVQAMTEAGTDDKTDPAGATTGSGTTEMTAEQRHELASKMVDRFSLWGWGGRPCPAAARGRGCGQRSPAPAATPPLTDVRRSVSENMGKSVLASLIGSMIPATSGMGVTSALKGVPIIGALSSLVMPTLSAGATYAIGKVFVEHFDSGGTLLDFNPPDYREFIKVQKEKWISRPAAPPAATDPAPLRRARGRRLRALDRRGLQPVAHAWSGGWIRPSPGAVESGVRHGGRNDLLYQHQPAHVTLRRPSPLGASAHF